MQIDCQSCPGRSIACDGCLMQVLFDPMTSADAPSVRGAPAMVPVGSYDDQDLHRALDVLLAARMVDSGEASAARAGIRPRQSGTGGRGRNVLRAG